MGSFSLWHWLIVVVGVGIPLAVIALTSAERRTSRGAYFAWLVGTLAAIAATRVAVGQVRDVSMSGQLALGQLVLSWVLFGFLIRAAVGRLQDAGHRRWWAMLFVVPVLNLVAYIVIGCLRPRTTTASPEASPTS